jgi:hypothetical protein
VNRVLPALGEQVGSGDWPLMVIEAEAIALLAVDRSTA